MQHLISIALVFLVSTACYLSSALIGYKVVALLLLVTVSLLAMLFDILPVLLAALLSALIWNFFFIPPLFTFYINDTEDALLFLMYFMIASLNGILTFKIRNAEKNARDKDEKENTIKLYNTLLNSLSHEMRTPLSTIIGSVDTIKENRKKLTPENIDDLFTAIDIASMRLNRQVENLLNINRLETGMLKLNKDWCDLNELIFSAIQKFSKADYQQNIIFDSKDDLPFFKLDAGLMEQVFHNLIHNAIQYTPKNATVRIDASYQSDACIIDISDNGKGFPEAEIQFLFDKFYRLPNSKTGGTGLGLSIAKGFIEAHNGNIIAENNKNGGATFIIYIPAETTFINNLKNE